jgi:hypothetical protein
MRSLSATGAVEETSSPRRRMTEERLRTPTKRPPGSVGFSRERIRIRSSQVVHGDGASAVFQQVSDLLGGQLSSWQNYPGAALGGAAGGEALLYTGPIGAGLVGGAAANVTKQLLKNLTGKQCGYNATSFLADTAVGGRMA